jgi:hypothetical protein
MGHNIFKLAATSFVAAATDSDFKNVTLLLPGNGTNGAQNNTFLDSSTNAFTITRNGNTTQGTFSPYGDNWSNYFDGSGDYLSLSNSADFQFNGQFCVEMWVNFSAINTNNFLVSQFNASGETGWVIRYTGTALRIYAENGTVSIDNSWTAAVGSWYHIAVTRDGSNVIRMFVNGSQIGSNSTNSTTMSATTSAYIGGHPSLSTDINAYISNLRIVKGSAVYTSNFTPSTAPLAPITNTKLLTCQSNRFIDTNTEVTEKTITVNGNPSVQRFSPFSPTAAYSTSTNGGSGYFDGTGDYLETSSSSNQWAFGTGDFTVECWLYTNAATNRVIMANRSGSTGLTTHWSLEFFNTAKRVEWHTGVAIIASSNTDVQLNAWVHIAVVRNSGTLKIYQNGVEVASASDANNYSSVNPLLIANEPVFPSGNSPFLGYIASIRIVKGTAVYTTGFTPPTAPLTAITNTSLLCNFTNAGIIDNAMMNDLETVGNAQISTSVSKFGGGSMAFDGTGDYLLVPDGPNLDFGTGAFTVEAWVNFSSVSGTRCIASNYLNSTSGWSIELSGGVIKVALSGDSYDITGTTTISTGTWYHVALSGTPTSPGIKLFINGTQEGSTYTGSVSLDTTSPINIGRLGTLGGDELNGYIDDLRITKGIARYTANFTAPTAALPTF